MSEPDVHHWTASDGIDLAYHELGAGRPVILLHGLLPHLSGGNTSDRSRQAYTLHVVEGTARYPAENWLRRPTDRPARGF